jgi:carboxylesterase type B
MAAIAHPEIGLVRGIASDGCCSFLGIPYARLEHRFAPAELPTYNGEGLEATKYGYVYTNNARQLS